MDSPQFAGKTGIVNAMSVDVEDYFHVSVFDGLIPRSRWDAMESRVDTNTRRLLEIFDEHGVRATFFVLGWVGERQPELLRAIVRSGHEVASHGYAHRLIYDQTKPAFRDDVRRAKGVLEGITGQRVLGYRAPSYSITVRSLWALDILIEEGYEYDSSIFPIRHDRYGIPVSSRRPYRIDRPAGTLMEVPGSTTTVGSLNVPVAGGGYFRILPYWWTAWGIARVNRREQRPAVFYLHPWEIDPEQPQLQAGRLGRFRHYRNLRETEGRLRRLLLEFRFDTIESLVKRVHEAAPLTALQVQPQPLPYVW